MAHHVILSSLFRIYGDGGVKDKISKSELNQEEVVKLLLLIIGDK